MKNTPSYWKIGDRIAFCLDSHKKRKNAIVVDYKDISDTYRQDINLVIAYTCEDGLIIEETTYPSVLINKILI